MHVRLSQIHAIYHKISAHVNVHDEAIAIYSFKHQFCDLQGALCTVELLYEDTPEMRTSPLIRTLSVVPTT